MIQNYGPIPTVTQNPNCDSRPIYTLNCRLLVTLQLSAVFRDFRRWLWVWTPLRRLLPFCPLSLIPQPIPPSPFMRVAEPSCRRRCLKCSGWALFLAALGTISFDFLVPTTAISRPDPRWEMCYSIIPLLHRIAYITSLSASPKLYFLQKLSIF